MTATYILEIVTINLKEGDVKQFLSTPAQALASKGQHCRLSGEPLSCMGGRDLLNFQQQQPQQHRLLLQRQSPP